MAYRYDPKGRQIWGRTFAVSVEVAKTQTVYDADDRAIATVRWERKTDTGGDLTHDNADKAVGRAPPAFGPEAKS